MIKTGKYSSGVHVRFMTEQQAGAKGIKLFKGNYLETFWLNDDTGKNGPELFVGMGNERPDSIRTKELCAKAVNECKTHELSRIVMDTVPFVTDAGIDALRDITEGACLGDYEQIRFPKKERQEQYIYFPDIAANDEKHALELIRETEKVTESVIFARNMVNLPGNRLRPQDFAEAICDFVKDTSVEAEVLDNAALIKKGLHALTGVGESSEYKPCMVILRYHGNPDSSKIQGLVGKGITCDTGGYCLKPADSMAGIKGDMAGGAAVCGAVRALAVNKVKVNVTAVIPIAENRISDGSLLPGDVIDSYSGKTIEVLNTDAEGRLILADAVAYAVKDEKVSRVLDIATLTGGVVNMLGFSTAGVLCDDDKYFSEFMCAAECAGERYLRLPYYEEQEKMIESQIADIKNMGEKYCGTITAGLFIRAFAENRPWLHMDIAGTAWTDKPLFAFQSKGATGAGVTTIYQLCKMGAY